MKQSRASIALLFLTLVISVTSIFISTHKIAPAAGSFNPTGGSTYLLQSSVSSSQTTIPLTSFTEPGSGIPYTMSYLGSNIEYGTISPSSGNSEFVAFTGITQNTNGTATLTGVTRGQARTPGTGGCVASSTLAHAYPGQTQFVLSNTPCFYSQYAVKQNDETISGLYTFTQPPVGINPGGSPNSSETVNGLVQLSTAAQAGAGTSLGNTGSRLVLPASLATSTPTVSCSAFCVVIATAGKISESFLNYAVAKTYTALNTFTSGLTSTGTTTISAASLTTNPLVLNGAVTKWPSTNAAGILANDGSGTLTWGHAARYTKVGASGINLSGTGYATSTVSMAIPAGVLTASSTIEIKGTYACASQSSTSGDCTLYVRDGTGAAFVTSPTLSPTTSHSWGGTFDVTIFANNSTSAQQTQMIGTLIDNTTESTTGVGVNQLEKLDTSSINLANATTINVVVRGGNGTTLNTINSISYVVNP